jgi:hypothetical protein
MFGYIDSPASNLRGRSFFLSKSLWNFKFVIVASKDIGHPTWKTDFKICKNQKVDKFYSFIISGQRRTNTLWNSFKLVTQTCLYFSWFVFVPMRDQVLFEDYSADTVGIIRFKDSILFVSLKISTSQQLLAGLWKNKIWRLIC